MASSDDGDDADDQASRPEPPVVAVQAGGEEPDGEGGELEHDGEDAAPTCPSENPSATNDPTSSMSSTPKRSLACSRRRSNRGRGWSTAAHHKDGRRSRGRMVNVVGDDVATMWHSGAP